MPLYSYKCDTCNHEMDLMTLSARRGLSPGSVCPQCHVGELVKVPAASNFVVKGFSAKNGYSGKGE
jgi:putative FmdB family regulatory protein